MDASGYVKDRECSKDGIFEHLHQHEGGPKRQISKECSHDDAAIEHGNSNVGACHIQIVDIWSHLERKKAKHDYTGSFSKDFFS